MHALTNVINLYNILFTEKIFFYCIQKHSYLIQDTITELSLTITLRYPYTVTELSELSLTTPLKGVRGIL